MKGKVNEMKNFFSFFFLIKYSQVMNLNLVYIQFTDELQIIIIIFNVAYANEWRFSHEFLSNHFYLDPNPECSQNIESPLKLVQSENADYVRHSKLCGIR